MVGSRFLRVQQVRGEPVEGHERRPVPVALVVSSGLGLRGKGARAWPLAVEVSTGAVVERRPIPDVALRVLLGLAAAGLLTSALGGLLRKRCRTASVKGRQMVK